MALRQPNRCRKAIVRDSRLLNVELFVDHADKAPSATVSLRKVSSKKAWFSR